MQPNSGNSSRPSGTNKNSIKRKGWTAIQGQKILSQLVLAWQDTCTSPCEGAGSRISGARSIGTFLARWALALALALNFSAIPCRRSKRRQCCLRRYGAASLLALGSASAVFFVGREAGQELGGLRVTCRYRGAAQLDRTGSAGGKNDRSGEYDLSHVIQDRRRRVHCAFCILS